MSRRNSLQDPSQFTAPSKHEQLNSESRSALRDHNGLPSVLCTLRGPYPEDVSFEIEMMITRNIIRYHHFDLF